jgi:hypothetical protein
MSTSVPGNIRRPSTKKPGATATGGKPDASASTSATPAKATPAKAAAAKTTTPAKSTGSTSASKVGTAAKPVVGKPAGAPKPGAGGKGRKPVVPIKVAQGRNWGPIAMFTAAGVVAAGILTWGGVAMYQATHKPTWDQRAAGIPGIVNYRISDPKDMAGAQHAWGPLTYKQDPPVGGTHNPRWQSCNGMVYPAEIPKEQAVHALEHGAVWITYNPSLSKDDVAKLATHVTGTDFMLMSPYSGPGLKDYKFSMQAWGYQLKLNDVNDSRINDFINDLRINATMEPQASCATGITDTGTVPLDLGKDSNGTLTTDPNMGATP